MNERLYEALEACLVAMDEGMELEKCLENYPKLADELRPTLEAADAARSLANIDVPVEAMNRSRTRLLGKAAMLRDDKTSRRVWMGLPRLAFSLLLAVVLLVMTSSGLLAVSAESLPGDRLYPVKRAVENLRVQFAPSGVQKYEAEWQYRERRIGEVTELLTMGEERNISFEGVVEVINDLDWFVSGIEVRLTDNTDLIGSIDEDMLVEVEGITHADGYVVAREIHLREYQFSGVVDSKTVEEWVISGIPLKIVPETQIGPNIGVGSAVLVLVRSDNDAEWKAIAILSLGMPTATPAPTESQVLETGTAEGQQEAEKSEQGDDSDPRDDQSTPEPKETGDDADSGEDNQTHKLKKKDDNSGCGSDKEEDDADCGYHKSTPEPKDKDSGNDKKEETPEPKEENKEPDGGDDESTEEPEDTPAPED
jgi:hypothetical protein